MVKPDWRRNVPPRAPDRRDVDCKHCGQPIVVQRDPVTDSFRVLGYDGRFHVCPEHPKYKAEKLLSQSRRLLASGKMTPSQRRDLCALIEKLEGGVM
jgi:hypothetical protein